MKLCSRNYKIMRKIYALLLSTIAISATNAQEDSTASKELAEVVIVGQHRPQSVKNSVYNVRIVNQERIRLSGATNVQQVLVNQLGFRISNDLTLGASSFELMGMAGRNVKILLDGVPMIDRNDARESLNQIDINSIERIELVEGPMSVSYGSDALAGVINIITKKPGKNSFAVNAKVQEETAGDEYSPFSYRGVHTQSIGVNGSTGKWNYAAGANHNDFNGYNAGDFGRLRTDNSTWRPKEQWLGNGRIGYTNNRINVYYRLDGLHEEIAARGPINLTTYRATDQYYISKRWMHQLQNQWRINEKMDLATIVSFTDYERRTKTYQKDFSTGTSELSTAQGAQDIAKFNALAFRNTFGYFISSKLSLQAGIDINREKASGDRIKGEPAINDYALFVSTEIKPTSKINIRPGLRFIKNSVYDAPPVIPSLNTKFVLDKNFDLRLSYAYGFRAPALRELYFNFVDANHIIIGNPDLKAEHSNSFAAFLGWHNAAGSAVRINSALGGFYNVFNDQINYSTPANPNDPTTLINIDKFKTTGGTWETKLDWKNGLNASLGFSYIGRYNSLSDTYKEEESPAFTWTPEVNSNITYTLKKINTSVALFYKFTGARPGFTTRTNQQTAQTEIVETKIESFHWADFTVTKPLFKLLTLSAGVKNIFDVKSLNNTGTTSGGTHSTSGPVTMAYGRSYFLGLAFQWTKK